MTAMLAAPRRCRNDSVPPLSHLLSGLLLLAVAFDARAADAPKVRVVAAQESLDWRDVAQLLQRDVVGQGVVAVGTKTRSIRNVMDGMASAGFALQIPFAFDSAVIPAAAHSQLDAVAKGIRALSDAPQILIAGHTDASGSKAYNQMLSQRRADAVRESLIARGVSANWLRTRGVGSRQPLIAESPNAAENRRVEVRRAE